MKIAILSYPMLFQNHGGLQVQILETIYSLNELGIDATLINPCKEKLSDYDIVHVFSAINGNHRIIEQAKAIEKPVVTSPLIQPHWDSQLGRRAKILESIVGRLTNWEVKTEYRHISSCLNKSDHLIALGALEKKAIINAFKISKEKIDIIPNGIPKRFFEADETLFVDKTGIEAGFILCVGSIYQHKNQSTLADATKKMNKTLVLIGPCSPANKPYLEILLKHPHVHYIGSLDYDDPLLASAYAAAGVFCLPSLSEVMPLSVLESLAAGTAVVMTKNHGMDTSKLHDVLSEITPLNTDMIQSAIGNYFKSPPDSQLCSSLVKDLTWNNVAKSITNIYTKLLS